MREAKAVRSLAIALVAAVFAPSAARAQHSPGVSPLGNPYSNSREWRSVLPAAATSESATPQPVVPREPTRVAQYPLENDPYEGPPVGSQAPSYSSTGASPQTSSPLYTQPQESEEPWIEWESTTVYANYLHDTAGGLGWSDVVAKSTIKFPNAAFVWLSPQAGAHFLTDAGMPNVPSSLYDVSLEVVFGLPLSDHWIFQGGVSPGIFSDFEGAGGDEFRLPSRALLFYKWSETFTIGGGVLWLDRPDVGTLPLIGLSYIPSDDFRVEIWFPRAKVSRRYWHASDFDRWIYAAAEFGGGSWAIALDNGQSDSFAYRDYRILFGVEQKAPHGLGWYVEGGYVFNRQMSFDRSSTEIDLDSTAAMMAGIRF